MNYCEHHPKLTPGIFGLIIFLLSFFFIIALTIPGLHINDNWITTNQLHQLFQGHQVLTSEGKYGYYFGEISSYFAHRSNILGYSLILPIISLPAMLFLTALGDHFRLGVILIWVTIPVILALIIQVYLPGSDKFRKIPIIIPALLFSLILLLINLKIYYPFPADFFIDPIETAALILTINIIFALLCAVVALIGLEIFHDYKKAFFSFLLIISCSSYIFWATDVKDHLLTVLIISLIILFFIRSIRDDSISNAGVSFFMLGVLTWTRPELGVSLFITLSLFFLLHRMTDWEKEKSYITKVKELSPFVFFPIGLIPFFLNNYLLTGNPIYPPFLEYESGLIPVSSQEIAYSNGITDTVIGDVSGAQSVLLPDQVISLLLKYYTLNSPSLLDDMKGILLFADSWSMPIIALSPFLIIGLCSVGILLLSGRTITKPDSWILYLCLFTIAGIILAYLRSFHGLHTSEGIGPDIRYLSPIYLPGGIIGLISMKYWKINPVSESICRKGIIYLLIGAPLIIILLLLTQPFGGGFYYFSYVLSLAVYALLVIFLIQCIFMELSGRYSSILLSGNLILLLMIPLAWQIMLVFLYSLSKFDGYSYWIPTTEMIFLSFIIPVT